VDVVSSSAATGQSLFSPLSRATITGEIVAITCYVKNVTNVATFSNLGSSGAPTRFVPDEGESSVTAPKGKRYPMELIQSHG